MSTTACSHIHSLQNSLQRCLRCSELAKLTCSSNRIDVLLMLFVATCFLHRLLTATGLCSACHWLLVHHILIVFPVLQCLIVCQLLPYCGFHHHLDACCCALQRPGCGWCCYA
ncbi:hypothetical protein COO60DRAFT_1474423 [Scenedesmus sp. NREL 46B-D3]|nr:hypothetical protein COO60DRAFT_1474423 [Scenedesmus sp. NREL 46B-D3]